MKKYINLEDMTNTNCSNVLNIIQKNGCVSRKQITEFTGLSWGGMTKIVNRLLENGYIIETKQNSSSKSGRTPGVISVNNQRNFVIGLDINKTGLKGLVMNLSGEILRNYSASPSARSKAELEKSITAFISDILSDFEHGLILAIGIAMQGIVDSKNGISVRFPGIDDWENVPLGDILSSKFNVNVFIEHDPDCLLYPYIEDKKTNRLLLRIDRSIGMAVSVKGKILKDSGILEIAHNIVVPSGKQCICGQKGCMEAYVRPCLKDNTPDISAIADLVPVLAILIKNLSGIFNVSTTILTGDLTKHKNLFEAQFLRELKSLDCTSEILFSGNADNAVLGAALIAINKSINSLVI